MVDDAAIPPPLLEFFRELRSLADDAVARLERATSSPPQSIDLEVHDAFHLHEASHITITPDTIRTTWQVHPPSVITPERFKEASVWLAFIATLSIAGRPAWLTAETLAVLESLMQLAERLLNVG